jgi:hypothetical protein
MNDKAGKIPIIGGEVGLGDRVVFIKPIHFASQDTRRVSRRYIKKFGEGPHLVHSVEVINDSDRAIIRFYHNDELIGLSSIWFQKA